MTDLSERIAMFQESEELRARHEGMLDSLRAMVDRAERESRDLTRNEERKWTLTLADAEMLAREVWDVESRLKKANAEADRGWRRKGLAGAVKQDRGKAERTAHHEGGHCVAGYLKGYGVESVSIQASDGRWSGAYHRKRGDADPVVHAAGFAAEILAGISTEPDWEGWGKGDTANLTAYYSGNAHVARFEQEADLQTAKDLLSPAWVAVRAVADALLKRGTLTGPQAEKLIEDALPVHLRTQAQHSADNRIGNRKAFARVS